MLPQIANVIPMEPPMSQLFGPVQQLGYVVRDLEAAMHHWTQNLHIGPFYQVVQPAVGGTDRQGKAQAGGHRVALTYSGELQIELIELIEQPDATPPTAAAPEGLHHIGFFTAHFDRDLQRAAEAGMTVEQSAAASDPAGKSTCFASSGHCGTVLKLIDLQSSNCELYRMVRAEAERWDGSGPVRRIEL